jgi:uncharacterized protein (DUF1330 family)
MTKAYVVGYLHITHAQGYAEYQKLVPATIAAFGGRYLVRGGAATQIEGQSHGGRNWCWSFPAEHRRRRGTTAMPIIRSFTTEKTIQPGI